MEPQQDLGAQLERPAVSLTGSHEQAGQRRAARTGPLEGMARAARQKQLSFEEPSAGGGLDNAGARDAVGRPPGSLGTIGGPGAENRAAPAAASSGPDIASVPGVGEAVDVCYFDLETQLLFHEVEGPRNPAALRLAVGVVYSTWDGDYCAYREDDASLLVDRLLRAKLVVGFNLLNFDYQVLTAYCGSRVYEARTLDMLDQIHKTLGFRVSLQSLAEATLGAQKTADGLQSVKWFREGRIDLVVDYCKADVDLTRRLFEYGLKEGQLFFKDKTGVKRRVAAGWSETVEDLRALPAARE